ncbi:MAG: alpha/beta hydrolase [Chloroflexota bacterium]|nr:alpha/beta hydrolase [Chloroflexota bacterium]
MSVGQAVRVSSSEEFQPQAGVVRETGLRYLSAGGGEPVVLLHGWGGYKEMWWGVMRVLSPSRRVVAFEWPGHGGSAPLESGEPVLETLADLTAASCEALGLERIALVGHSFGGNVAARLALDRPGLVARLALIDAAIDARYISRTGRLCVHPRFGSHVLRLNRLLSWPLARLGESVSPEHEGGFLRPLARRQSYMARVEVQALLSFLTALYEGSLGDRVSGISQPTLVLTGERDPLVHPQQARELAEKIPDARLCVIPRAYHCPMDERPALFNRALLDFLRDGPRPSAE